MYLELVGGLIYLLLAGDLLVRGAVALSRRAQIPPMVVGLTVVAMGTSAPELFVSVGAAFKGAPGIALGNVVGSNIANILLVLGLPAIIYPTLCNQESVRSETLLVLGVSLLFAALCFAGPLGPLQGVVMLALLCAVTVRMLRAAQMGQSAPDAAIEFERVLGLPGQRRMIAFFLVVGVAGLPIGANMMVDGAVELARAAGISNAAIGLTVVALGTSLPELGTTVVAAIHRHSDVAIGNVLGSNLFNILAIMGITATISPSPIPVPDSFLRFDLLVMMAATLALGYFVWTGRIGRRAGAVLLASYALYITAVFGAPMATATAAALVP